MENERNTAGAWEMPKPTKTEIAEYKRCKANAERIENALMLGVDQLAAALELNARACAGEEPVNYIRGLTRRELVNAVGALGNAALALGHLRGYTIPPYGYTEDMEAGKDGEG